MDCWLSSCTPYFLGGWQVCFLLQLFPDTVKAMSWQLVPFRGDGFVGKLFVMNWDFTDSLLTVVSLNLGYREEPQKDITRSLDSIYLPSPFNTPILSPPTTPITTTCDIITHSKKLPKIKHNLGVRNLYTHTNRWMNNWCKFSLHSLRHWEATTQWLLKISVSPNEALWVLSNPVK